MSIKNQFDVFSLPQLLSAFEVIKFIQVKGLSTVDFLSDMEKHIEKERQRIRESNKINSQTKRHQKNTSANKTTYTKPARVKNLNCPKCGHMSFASSVCPGCAKGKAGIKSQYVCGDCDFAFYLD
jgi:transcription elongation factor Elf1